MGFKYFRWFLKDMGKRPNGPRLPIGAEGGQVVLDSLLEMKDEVTVDPAVAARARTSVERMINLKS